ncbi:MAG: LSM domain-containing protein, partial [Promethearchaeia archaeon]
AHSLPIRGPGTVPGSSNSSASVGVADGQGSFQTAEEGSCEGFVGDGKHPHPAEMPEQTPVDLMGRMVGAMVTVNLKIGPQLCGRLQTIDAQMNMLLGRPVQQWVNGTVRL